MDELKQAFIGNRGASEAFYSTNPSQSFTPINQKTPFQWSFNDISIQNLALDAPRKPVYAGYRENNVFEHELENEHRMVGFALSSFKQHYLGFFRFFKILMVFSHLCFISFHSNFVSIFIF